MKRSRQFILVAATAWAVLNCPAQAENPSMTIDTSRTGAPIHPYVYGQFTELLGNMYEKGLWAEMLSDRKFFISLHEFRVR